MTKGFLIAIIFSSFTTYIQCQDTTWNILRKGMYARNEANLLYEADSFYICVSTAIDTFNQIEQGISLSAIDKISGRLVKSFYYEEDSVQLINNLLNNIVDESDNIIIAQQSDGKTEGISLFSINKRSLRIKKFDTILTPEKNDINYLFLNDLKSIGDYYFVMATIIYDKNNEPLIIKVNKNTLEHKYIRFKNKLENITSCKLLGNSEGILGLFTYYGKEIVTGGHYFIQFDLDGNVLWEYRSPDIVTNWDINSVISLENNEILVSTMDVKFNYTTFLVENRPSIMRFNTNTRKIKYYTGWNEILKPFLPPGTKVIDGHRPKEYILMCGDYNKTGNYNEGRVVKFDEDGKLIWKKNYVYFPQQGVINQFTDITATSDKNYLMCGWNGLGESNWLVKINEDGDILKIDTTTSVIDQVIPQRLNIKIHPNPTNNVLIIDQGDISNVSYMLYDLNGILLKTILVPEKNTNVIYDITSMSDGLYTIFIEKDGKKIGSSKIVVEK